MFTHKGDATLVKPQLLDSPHCCVMILEHLPHLASKSILLASASPRRLQLLQLVGINPKVVTSTFEETLPKSDYKSAADYAVATSKGKALEVAERLSDANEPADLVIGADTVHQALADAYTWILLS